MFHVEAGLRSSMSKQSSGSASGHVRTYRHCPDEAAGS